MTSTNITAFQKSISDEIIALQNRVRYLIGSRHWGEEGRYKESIIKKIIRQFLPDNFVIASGFIVGSDDKCSNQIDILIYDNTHPIVFKDGDFVVVTQDMVKAVIEVKSKIYTSQSHNNSLYNILEHFSTSLRLFPLIVQNDSIFKGIFAFETDYCISNLELLNNLDQTHLGVVNNMSLGKDLFVKKRNNINAESARPHSSVECNGPYQNIYDLRDLSFGYFISNLIHAIVPHDLNERYCFSFPISSLNGKEDFLKYTIPLN